MKKFLCSLMILAMFIGIGSAQVFADQALTGLNDNELLELRSEINKILIAHTPKRETSPEGDFLYASNGEEVHIRAYYGTGSSIVIPDTIDGCPVTALDDKAFYENESLNSVVLPPSITLIGNYCFYGCSALTKLEFDQEMKDELTIGESAFKNCKSLSTIVFPKQRLESFKIKCEAFYNVPISDTLVFNASIISFN